MNQQQGVRGEGHRAGRHVVDRILHHWKPLPCGRGSEKSRRAGEAGSPGGDLELDGPGSRHQCDRRHGLRSAPPVIRGGSKSADRGPGGRHV
jgi:hypothetical protein